MHYWAESRFTTYVADSGSIWLSHNSTTYSNEWANTWHVHSSSYYAHHTAIVFIGSTSSASTITVRVSVKSLHDLRHGCHPSRFYRDVPIFSPLVPRPGKTLIGTPMSRFSGVTSFLRSRAEQKLLDVAAGNAKYTWKTRAGASVRS